MEPSQSQTRGQSIVLVAVALALLVLFVAVAVDISNTYVQRRTAQNAADAAALAGARELSQQLNVESYSAGSIKAEMNSFAESNGVADTDGTARNSINNNVVGYYLNADGTRFSEVPIGSVVGAGYSADVRGIEAVTVITAPTFFGGIVGLHGLPVHASAAVILEGTCANSCVVPIATFTMTFSSEATCYNIWNGDGPGNFGWLNWSIQEVACDQGGETCSIPCLEQNLSPDTCRSGLISVHDWVAGSAGDMNSGQIRKVLDEYIGPPRVPFTVVVWDVTNEGTGCGRADGGLWYYVAGFAKMELLGYQLAQGQSRDTVDPSTCVRLGEEPNGGNRLTARFIDWVEGEDGNCDPTGTLLVPRLVR